MYFIDKIMLIAKNAMWLSNELFLFFLFFFVFWLLECAHLKNIFHFSIQSRPKIIVEQIVLMCCSDVASLKVILFHSQSDQSAWLWKEEFYTFWPLLSCRFPSLLPGANVNSISSEPKQCHNFFPILLLNHRQSNSINNFC